MSQNTENGHPCLSESPEAITLPMRNDGFGPKTGNLPPAPYDIYEGKILTL